MSELEIIIDKIKEFENIKKDKEVADLLGISESNLYQMKKREKIPYLEIINYCHIKKISTDLFFMDKMSEITTKINFKNENYKIIDSLKDENQEIIYHVLKAETLKIEKL